MTSFWQSVIASIRTESEQSFLVLVVKLKLLCNLYWCCSDLGLAILRRGSKAGDRDKSPGTRLVARDQAEDRKLG